MALSTTHRPSALNQQNKRHNVLGHKTKGQLASLTKGRVNVKTSSKKIRELSRQQRRNRVKQIRASKREEVVFRKRLIGSARSPPFLVTIVPLSLDLNPRLFIKMITNSDPAFTVTFSSQGIVHLSCPRFKQRFSFYIPPVNDLTAILDAVKVSDTLLFLWPFDELESSAELTLSCIMGQGLPSYVHVAMGLEDLSQKEVEADSSDVATGSLLAEFQKALSLSASTGKRVQYRQRLTFAIESLFPGPAKVHFLERDQDAFMILRQIGSQKQASIHFRDTRCHIFAEDVKFIGQGHSGVLEIYGYVRGQPLSVNGLVHIPGWDQFQIEQIDSLPDPHPLDLGKGRPDDEEERTVLYTADPDLQENLVSVNEVDPMEAEQTLPLDEELKEAEQIMKQRKRTKRVPRGTSEYHAAWIPDEDDTDGGDDDDSRVGLEEGYEKMMDSSEFVGNDEDSRAPSEEEEDESEEEYETVSIADGGNYDEVTDYELDKKYLYELHAARDDVMFPDEIDTPQDMPARIRFQKYRGLESFRTSPWNPKENLPVDYAKIFQFENFIHARKKVMLQEREGVMPGWYVAVHVPNVPKHLFLEFQQTRSPLVLFSLFPHEQKMSVLNVVLKSHPSGHFRALKSKEKLIFNIGFRRFTNCPIFSEHTTGDKHKFLRFFHPGSTVVATMFGPITFPPMPVLVFRERPDGVQDLIAKGSLLSVDPNRIVCKRVVLSGCPFKINRKSAVVRFMFFNREDILWFKPVELKTKWGRRGHIQEPLGTHGHMKCHFNGQVKSQDTILLNLYKRVFPKWRFDPHVPRISSLNCHTNDSDSNSDSDVPPLNPCKKQRSVHFER